jgi:hypothetical protein
MVKSCGGVLCHDSCPKGTIIFIPNLDLRPLWMVLSMFWLSFMVRRSQVAINCVFGSKSVIQHRCSSSPSLSSLAEMFHGLMVRACRKWRCHWGSTRSRERQMFNGDAKSHAFHCHPTATRCECTFGMSMCVNNSEKCVCF